MFTTSLRRIAELCELAAGTAFVYSSAMKSAIWISYDLGVRGDYESLYAWLDDHGAQECGDSLAFLNYTHSGSLVASVTKEIRKTLRTTKLTRIYLIYRDPETRKIKGTFLLGGRKAAPWSGYGSQGGKIVDVDET